MKKRKSVEYAVVYREPMGEDGIQDELEVNHHDTLVEAEKEYASARHCSLIKRIHEERYVPEEREWQVWDTEDTELMRKE